VYRFKRPCSLTNRDTKKESILEPHVADNALVILLVHESREGREASNRKQLNVTGIPVAGLRRLGGLLEKDAIGHRRSLKADERASMGRLKTIGRHRGRRGSSSSLSHNTMQSDENGILVSAAIIEQQHSDAVSPNS
jgi:hypothetical protein